jgi:hypothetical protein
MIVMNHGGGENDDGDDIDDDCVVDGADDLRSFCMPNL